MPRIFCSPVIINILSRSEALTTDQLYERTGYNKQALWNCLDRLVKKGLVRRVGKDHRSVLWELVHQPNKK